MESSYKFRIRSWNKEFHDNIEMIIDLMPDHNIFESEAALNSLVGKWNPWKALCIDLEHITADEKWHTQYLNYLQDNCEDSDDNCEDLDDNCEDSDDNCEDSDRELNDFDNHDQVSTSTVHNNKKYTNDQIKLFFDIYPALSWCLLAIFDNARIDAINIGKLDEVMMLDLCNEDISRLALKIYDNTTLNELLKYWNGSIDSHFAKLAVSSNNLTLLQNLYNRNAKIFWQRSVINQCKNHNALYILENAPFEKFTANQESDFVIGIIESGNIVRFKLHIKINLAPYFNYIIKYNIADIRLFSHLYSGAISEIDGKFVHQLKYALKYNLPADIILSYLDNNNSFYSGLLDDIPPNMDIAIKIWNQGKFNNRGDWDGLVVRLCTYGINMSLEKCPAELLDLIINHLATFPDKIYKIVEGSLMSLPILWNKLKSDKLWKDVVNTLSINKKDEMLKNWLYNDFKEFTMPLMEFIRDNSSQIISDHFASIIKRRLATNSEYVVNYAAKYANKNIDNIAIFIVHYYKEQ